MAEKLTEILSGFAATGEFQPHCHYSREADALTVHFSGDPDYSKRLTDHVTLLLSQETGQVVGCRVKGVSGILEELPNYVRVNHDGCELSVIFLPFLPEARDSASRQALRELATTASKLNLRLECQSGS